MSGDCLAAPVATPSPARLWLKRLVRETCLVTAVTLLALAGPYLSTLWLTWVRIMFFWPWWSLSSWPLALRAVLTLVWLVVWLSCMAVVMERLGSWFKRQRRKAI